MTGIEDLGGPWMDGSGEVPDKTNLVIAALLQQDFEKFGVGVLRQAIEQVADVHSDAAVGKYKRRVIEHGPFEQEGPGLWRIEQDD